MRCSSWPTPCCVPTGRCVRWWSCHWWVHRRGHGSWYAALDRGRLDVGRLRRSLTAVPLPRAVDGRLVLAVDVTCWLRPDAHTSPERVLCHTYGRGKDQHIMIPGCPYSPVVALDPRR